MIAINVVAKGRQNLRIVSTGCDNIAMKWVGAILLSAPCKSMPKKS